MYVHDGFFGQRLRVLPRPVTDAARTQPIVRHFLVTDAGYFPHAAMHGRARPRGARETIVMVCTDGAGWVEVADQNPERVERGDAVVLPSGIRHRYQADRQDPWTIWWAHVTGDVADDFVSAILKDGAGPVVRLRDVYSAVQALEEAVTALEEDETMSMLVIAAGAAWRVLAQVLASRLQGAGPANDRIRHVQEYLRSNLDTTFSVPELAAMAGLSTSHFSALFRTAAETSVKEYLKRLRSARARELLLTTDLTVTQIANAVGYEDALYFSRQFRAVNGVSPTQFRSQADFESLAPA
ncbi:AraC family transcriptional regulator [Microbacterium pumilum]|uniref:AraC family transcriptional regulator n=1 Tax=Microbacterium pumilum TaxID=344165 RepID=A0ABN2RNJ5_9MICO